MRNKSSKKFFELQPTRKTEKLLSGKSARIVFSPKKFFFENPQGIPEKHDVRISHFEKRDFPYEKITTKPAILRIVSTFEAQVILTEGRYHQIKRMFGRFRNPVIGLHRHSIGQLTLDKSLKCGESRLLNVSEVSNIGN